MFGFGADRLARLLDERMGELDGGEGSGGHGYLLIGAFCANQDSGTTKGVQNYQKDSCWRFTIKR